MLDFLKQLTDPQSIIHYGGLWLLLFVVFAETGLFVGFFLPGDSLIFISGLLCATKPQLLDTPFIVLLPLLMLAAIIGNVFGYWFGKKTGEKIKFKWLDENNKDTDYFFELRILVDELTKDVSLMVIDYAEEEEVEESKLLWENQISDLKHVIGSV